MPTAITASRAAFLKHSLRKSLAGIAAVATLAAFLWPVLAQAQSWNPTASDGNFNTAAGTGALNNHTSGGSSNTASGFQALSSNTTGSFNTANGYQAISSNTTGTSNTASGFQALTSNTTGFENTAGGTWALRDNTTGSDNTASGEWALISNTTGTYNTASGAYALQANTTGNDNTASGAYTLNANTAGSNNVAMGFNALGALAGGGSNIALGTNAGMTLTNGSRNIYIGHPGAAKETNIIRIGQTQTKTFIAGIAGVAASGATVVVKANGQLGVVASSARYKTDIHDLTDASDRLGQLHPVTYQYKTEPGVTHFGLIAEEVDRVMPELVVRDEQNRPETVQYQELIPLLLQQVKAQRALLEQQARAASRDHAIIEQLTAKVDELSRARLAAK